MKSLHLFPVLLVMLAGTSALSAQEPASRQASDDGAHQALHDRIDNYLKEAVNQGFSGTVLVAKDNQVVINKGYGSANREFNRPNSPETIFTIGSVTKQFTATAILKLQQQGKLNVTDPLSKYFSDLPEDKATITIHQLLTHTSGIGDRDGRDDFDMIAEDEFFRQVFSDPLLFQPGSKHQYCNAGYSVLGKLIENVSGQSYEQYLNEQLFVPAGMNLTGYFLPEWDLEKVACGYARGVRRMGSVIERCLEAKQVSWILKGNGGIHSTSLDMYRWYQALESGKVLPESLMEQLTKPHVAEQEDGSSHYGYGWAIFNSDRNTKLISHNGGNGIFFHDFLWLPEENTVILYFTNAYSRNVDSVGWEIEKMVFDESFNPKPIKKNPVMLVFSFVNDRAPEDSNQLLTQIRAEYQQAFRTPDLMNDLGYMVLEEKPHWAVELFKINTQLHESDANAWDSLGDGYMAIENKQEAIRSYQKAVEMNCEGSAEKLKKLQDK